MKGYYTVKWFRCITLNTVFKVLVNIVRVLIENFAIKFFEVWFLFIIKMYSNLKKSQ